MVADIDQKFREAFILFSSCNDHLEINQFCELMNSFGIIITNEEKIELPDKISMDYWMDFARKHFNYKDPFKHITSVFENDSNNKIRIDNFVGIMKALDARLTDKDFEILMELTNPEKKNNLDLKIVSETLAKVI